jgi:hypothetical protein
MRRICLVAFLATLAVPSISQGAPNAVYNPANGNVTLINDSPNPLFAITIKSELGTLTGTPVAIPGSVIDTADQPFFLAYFNLPTGTHNIGNIAAPNAPSSDLSGYFQYTATGPRYPFGVPEPSSLAILGGGALLGLAKLRQRKSRHAAASRT